MGALSGSMRPEHPRSRPLAALVTDLGFVSSDDLDGIDVSGITMATAQVQPGDIFVGLPGAKSHGAKFAAQAAAAGAVAVVTDEDGALLAAEAGLPILLTPHPRAAMGALASWVYQTEDLSATTFGVTVTNGKTSVVYLLTAILGQLGVKSGLSSTAERRIGDVTTISGLTTPESTELHALLARMSEASVRAIALEVSAQALSRHRVDGVHFDVVGFTNLSHDHFDDYLSYEDYFHAKAQLFDPERASRGVVIVDDAWGQRLAEESRIPVTTIATDAGGADQDANWHSHIVEESNRHTRFILTGPDGRQLETSVPLLGRFMVANAALAIVMLVESGYDLDMIAQALERDGGIQVYIPGRSEIVSGAEGPVFYVDYGHTPDAFRGLLDSIRPVCSGRVFFVFGADGDRDKSKRAEMGAIAARGADVVIITDFHPRTEDPAVIRQALLDGARGAGTNAEIIEVADPTAAVRLALQMADESDAIIYAGPGHENYREVNGVHLDYDARDDVKMALREAGWPARGDAS